MKHYKVTNFSLNDLEDMDKVEEEINSYAEDGYRLIASPTDVNGYGLLIFEREE